MEVDGNVFENETAFDLLIRLGSEELLLTTSLPDLNPVIVLHPGKCYEINGEIGVGKTQFQICYSLATKLLLTKKKAKVGWISAVPLRTDHLSLHFGVVDELLKEEMLERVVCKHVEKIAEFVDSLNHFLQMISIQLIVVDDIDALLHDTVYSREEGRNVQLDVAEKLRKLARLGSTVVVTNHITHWRGYPAPALGEFWTSQITNRFYVEKEADCSRVVSNMSGSNETTRSKFKIGAQGLESVD